MRKALHARDDIDRLYVSGKEGGRGLASIEDSINASIQWIEDYIQKCEERLITATRNDTEHKDKQNNNNNNNNQKTKMERKTTLWMFQATNNRHLTRENVDVAKKGKP